MDFSTFSREGGGRSLNLAVANLRFLLRRFGLLRVLLLGVFFSRCFPPVLAIPLSQFMFNSNVLVILPPMWGTRDSRLIHCDARRINKLWDGPVIFGAAVDTCPRGLQSSDNTYDVPSMQPAQPIPPGSFREFLYLRAHVDLWAIGCNAKPRSPRGFSQLDI